MKIEFIASIGVIAADPPQSRELYVDALGLPLERAKVTTTSTASKSAAASTSASGRWLRQHRPAAVRRNRRRTVRSRRRPSSSRFRTPTPFSRPPTT
jgi:catechol 2,3-dioxygenase-like lactoylglutathione lyase family enzyme